MSLPEPALESRRIAGGRRLWVVREDLLPGGTKRRVAPIVLDGRPAVYPTPAEGHAQLALALACADLGIPCTIVVASRASESSITRRARAAGAEIRAVRPGYLSLVRARARELAEERGAQLVPFSLRDPRVLDALAELAGGVFARLPSPPAEIWCAVGSGLLCRALQQAAPLARAYGVQIGGDGVLLADGVGRAEILKAPERFSQRALLPPPFPSCAEYDAKAWRFIEGQAADGALFWNVAA